MVVAPAAAIVRLGGAGVNGTEGELRNREPDYGDLVSECRRKQGLPR